MSSVNVSRFLLSPCMSSFPFDESLFRSMSALTFGMRMRRAVATTIPTEPTTTNGRRKPPAV